MLELELIRCCSVALRSNLTLRSNFLSISLKFLFCPYPLFKDTHSLLTIPLINQNYFVLNPSQLHLEATFISLFWAFPKKIILCALVCVSLMLHEFWQKMQWKSNHLELIYLKLTSRWTGGYSEPSLISYWEGQRWCECCGYPYGASLDRKEKNTQKGKIWGREESIICCRVPQNGPPTWVPQ